MTTKPKTLVEIVREEQESLRGERNLRAQYAEAQRAFDVAVQHAPPAVVEARRSLVLAAEEKLTIALKSAAIQYAYDASKCGRMSPEAARSFNKLRALAGLV
jgi:hypothetical protein